MVILCIKSFDHFAGERVSATSEVGQFARLCFRGEWIDRGGVPVMPAEQADVDAAHGMVDEGAGRVNRLMEGIDEA